MNKISRPRVPKSKAKAVLIGARLSPAEAREAERAIASSPHQDKSKWLRDAIKEKSMRRPIWLRSKWTKGQLHGKPVQFKLIRPDWKAEGVGEFSVDENKRGEISIDILGVRKKTPSGWVQNRFWIFPEDEPEIEVHPDQATACFRLLE
jgi:hypothetical protein